MRMKFRKYELESNVTVPVLDQPITSYEMIDSFKDMKNGGFDFNQPILSILCTHFSVVMLLILNFLLYVKYPIHLGYLYYA